MFYQHGVLTHTMHSPRRNFSFISHTSLLTIQYQPFCMHGSSRHQFIKIIRLIILFLVHTFCIILKATISSVLRHFALYTRPKDPSPTKPKTSYFSIVRISTSKRPLSYFPVMWYVCPALK